MKDKKEYTAPELTVVTFKTERGYASSSFRISHIFLSQEADDMMSNQESWGTNDDAFSGGWD